MNTREYIAAQLRRLRKERGLSADEVGAVVGKTGKAVHAWEVGYSMPSVETIIELCSFFDVPISKFCATESSSVTVDISDLDPDAQARILRIVDFERKDMLDRDRVSASRDKGVLRVENSSDDVRWISYCGDVVIPDEG